VSAGKGVREKGVLTRKGNIEGSEASRKKEEHEVNGFAKGAAKISAQANSFRPRNSRGGTAKE